MDGSPALAPTSKVNPVCEPCSFCVLHTFSKPHDLLGIYDTDHELSGEELRCVGKMICMLFAKHTICSVVVR